MGEAIKYFIDGFKNAYSPQFRIDYLKKYGEISADFAKKTQNAKEQNKKSEQSKQPKHR